MEPKKAYGVEQALGRAVADAPGGLDALRAMPDKAALRRFLDAHPARLPTALVDDYLASVPDADWPKARAKIVLAAKVAAGLMEAGKGHEAGRGVRKG